MNAPNVHYQPHVPSPFLEPSSNPAIEPVNLIAASTIANSQPIAIGQRHRIGERVFVAAAERHFHAAILCVELRSRHLRCHRRCFFVALMHNTAVELTGANSRAVSSPQR